MMTPLKILKQAVTIFEQKNITYCLVGGHAASLYRVQERLTRDVDFAVLGDSGDVKKMAEDVILELGLKPMIGFIPTSPQEQKRNSTCMVSATPAKHEMKGIIDILLPVLPWVTQAVERAQYNKINMGFASVPTIPPEDLIVAKCYALNNSPDRFQDLDDLKEIFTAVSDLDLDYVNQQLGMLNVSIPESIKKYVRQKRLGR